MSKYLIAVVLLLGLMQGKTEALEEEFFLLIKEFAVVSKKYKECSNTKDDKKRLACFDSLTKYIKERDKKYENFKRDSEKQLKNMVKDLDKSLGLKK